MNIDPPKPLFEVGEEVYVVADYQPQFEGVIVGRAWVPMAYSLIDFRDMGSSWIYKVQPIIEQGWWTERCLRKRYKPGNRFDKIIDSLKQPEKEVM